MRSILSGLVTAAMAIGFLISATGIQSSEAGLVGPRFVPLIVAAILLVLALLLVLSGLRRREPPLTAPPRDDERQLDLKRLGLVALPTLLGVAFLFLLSRIGYLAAVFLFLPTLVFTFGERQVIRLLTSALGGAAAFHLVFVELMGVFMPKGSWFDLAQLLGL